MSGSRRFADTDSGDPLARTPTDVRWLAPTLLIGGTLHFLAPTWFDRIIPAQLPGPVRGYTYASGIAALGIGAGLVAGRTRCPAAALAGVFFWAVMPAKVRLAVLWWRNEELSAVVKVVGILQLFWQIPFITAAGRVYRHSCGRATSTTDRYHSALGCR